MNSISTRSGMGMLRFMFLVVLTAAVIAVGVGAWANFDKDRDGDGKADGLTFHVLDPIWWGATRDEVKPMLRHARDRAMEMREDIWSDGGMVDKAQDWLESTKQGQDAYKQATSAEGQVPVAAAEGPQVGNRSQTIAKQTKQVEATRAAGTTAAAATAEDEAATDPQPGGREVALPPLTANPISDLTSAPTLHLEDNIGDASEYFAVGLVAYKMAKPVAGAWTPETEAKLFEAHVHFRSVRALLVGTLEEYEKRPDCDPELLEFGKGLLERSNLLLLESS